MSQESNAQAVSLSRPPKWMIVYSVVGLSHLTVRQNLQLGFLARSDKPNGTVEETALNEVCDLFPKHTQILNRPGGVLSGGEQQQLAIGRAILSNPKLLLLDESTEGIPPSIKSKT